MKIIFRSNINTVLLIILTVSLFFKCQKVDQNELDVITISKKEYKDKLYGFWLGECIANWTGLVTEMDKIGNIGEIKTGDFYTREDGGKPDQPSRG